MRGHDLLRDQVSPVEQIGARVAILKAALGACGRRFDPMSVAVSRAVNVVMTAAERKKAIETRIAARRRVTRLAQRPNGLNKASILSYADTHEAAEAGALYGTPHKIGAKLQALRDVGAELLNSAGGAEALRCFAREVMPAFSREPMLHTAEARP